MAEDGRSKRFCPPQLTSDKAWKDSPAEAIRHDPSGCFLDDFDEISFVGLKEVQGIPRFVGTLGLPRSRERKVKVCVSTWALALPDAGSDCPFANN